MEPLKKLLNYKSMAIAVFVIVYLWCCLPATGIFEDTYYQYTSGGLSVPLGNQNFISKFDVIKPLEYYTGMMNHILRPVKSTGIETFDIRILGFIYFLVLLTCLIFILRKVRFPRPWQNWLFPALCIFIFADFGYLLNLNSPNVEPVFLIGILSLITISILQIHSSRATLLKSLLYALIALFLGGVKTGYAFLTPVLMLLPFSWFFIRKDAAFRAVNILLILSASVGAIYFFGAGVSDEMKRIDITSSYIDSYNDSAEIISSYLPENYAPIIENYKNNPTKFIENLKIAANNAYEIRPRYLSNYSDENKLKEGFTVYSNIKRRLIQPDLWFLSIFLLAVILFSSFKIKKETIYSYKANYLSLIMLSIIAFCVFCAPVIISGQANIARNLFLYNIFFDIILIYAIIGGITVAANRRDKLKLKYGIK